MMKTNPITPPRELVREWYGSEDCPDGANALANYLCTQAAQWGADQELRRAVSGFATSTSKGSCLSSTPCRPPPQAAELEGAGA
jgi:hypothetical protein